MFERVDQEMLEALSRLAILFQLQMSPLTFPRPFQVCVPTLFLHHVYDTLRDICLCWSNEVGLERDYDNRWYVPRLNMYNDIPDELDGI